MTPTDRKPGATSSAVALLTRAAWTALALAAARFAVLVAMERLAHGTGWMRVGLRLSAAMGSELATAVIAGLVAAALAELGRRLATRRRVATWIALVVAAALFLVVLAGWATDDLSRAVGLRTERGRMTVAALAVVALGSAAILTWRTRATTAGRPAILVLAIAALVILPFGGRWLLGGVEPRMELRTVIREVLVDPPGYDTVRAREDQAPYVDVICPSMQYIIDGADMVSLVLPPPAEVRFTVRPEDGGARLDARAGIDRGVIKRYEEELAGHAVRFEVLVDDSPAFETDVPVRRVGRIPSSEWVPVGGDEGLALRAGQTVTLRTTLRDEAGAEKVPDAPLQVGFGGMLLERRTTAPRQRSSPERPNIVLVVMDTLRADRLPVYGYDRPTAPHLERLAARGTTFELAHSTSSWTWPSTASLLTGMHPQEHGVLDKTSCFLAESLQTLPEVLQRAGYTTAAWSGNPLIVPDKNFDQGFESFDHGKASTRESPAFMPAALEWIEAMAGTRFFLYLQLMDPHAPFAPLPEGRTLLAADAPDDIPPHALSDYSRELLGGGAHGEDGRWVDGWGPSDERIAHMSDLYDASVWSGDWWLGRILDTLEDAGIADETVVVFTSDHGEELFDHGLAAHGHSLHRELVHVPLVMAGPGIARGVRRSEPVSNRHLAPTLARLGGAELDTLHDPVDLLASSSLAGRPVFFSTTQGWWNGAFPQPLLGWLAGGLVLHYAPEGRPWGVRRPAPDGQWRLFDLERDPGEQRDVAPEHSERADALRAAVRAQESDLLSRRATPTVRAGDATLEMLRGIGYLGSDEDR